MAWQGLKLNLRVAQKQILTPGLVQMVGADGERPGAQSSRTA